ncbi:SPFH domain-containing protein [Thermoleptolyngbya sp. PKUAC-SCTB121]|uniref:SPFH domain-containing protein n=1 Tax=Thermoleptolyngbya sp. PKUAC-SCTB121 TaxID=2811482 RepID=UPI0019626608|nr:SPFH domain-containing protein [Thermoleptolyngbya sp. PKUAC-SCTB121]
MGFDPKTTNFLGFRDLCQATRWGTSNPIILRDAELGPVRLRAYGTYNVRIVQPEVLLQELVSTDGLFQVDEVSDHIRNMIMTAFNQLLQQGLTAQTYVWRSGMNGWQFANAVPELAVLLPPSPPPAP